MRPAGGGAYGRTMPPISRGFFGRRAEADPARLPPGQYLTRDFPVLSAGPTPKVHLHRWSFTVEGEIDEPRTWSWEELQALPHSTYEGPIHCVTTWSKFGMRWTGVSVDTLLDVTGLQPEAAFVMAVSHTGYTTNLPLDDVRGGRAWIAWEVDGEPLPVDHGGPARLFVPHLYFWKSAKWVAGLQVMDHDEPGFWEQNGYHDRGDPWLEQRYQGD
jgi:DMSO/TMAO reductase YedYZ molybdopterin-dependent catalytic subunit